MSVFVSAQLRIDDREGYREYEAGFAEVFERYKGRMRAVVDDPEVLEGEWPYTRAVLIEFPTREDALAWFEAPEYQAIAELRRRASVCSAVLLPELEA